MALGAGVLVDLLGLLAFADDASDAALADLHHEAVDRGVVGQREDVFRFDLLVERVVELLVDGDRCDVAQDLRLDVGVLERDGDVLIGRAGPVGDEPAAPWGVVAPVALVAREEVVVGWDDDPELIGGVEADACWDAFGVREPHIGGWRDGTRNRAS